MKFLISAIIFTTVLVQFDARVIKRQIVFPFTSPFGSQYPQQQFGGFPQYPHQFPNQQQGQFQPGPNQQFGQQFPNQGQQGQQFPNHEQQGQQFPNQGQQSQQFPNQGQQGQQFLNQGQQGQQFPNQVQQGQQFPNQGQQFPNQVQQGQQLPNQGQQFPNQIQQPQGQQQQSTTTLSLQVQRCMEDCIQITQGSYNPVCASDMQSYHNQERLDCVNECGANLTKLNNGACPSRNATTNRPTK